MKIFLVIFYLSLVLLVVPRSQGAEKTDVAVELKQDPYFSSLLQIGIKKSQTKKFKKLINDYAVERAKAFKAERRKTVERDFDLAMKKIRIKKGKKFSKKMKRLLDSEQFERFHAFHRELDKILASRETINETYDIQGVYSNHH
ncbi:MAG: hypothetical protein ACI89U_002448 [Gammaproteobacteria bacterium]|jgi:hypothetical protein